MPHIVFHKVSVRNFLSYGNAPTEIPLNKHALTLLSGKNGNGKSSAVLDSICFALYKRTYRNIKIGNIINTFNNKNCVVELEFDIGGVMYKIIRGLKPNVFEIYKDGSLLNPPTDSRDYQKVLEESILGFDFKVFSQVVAIGTDNFTPFMSLKAADRKNLIDTILPDIGVFTEMASELKVQVGELESEIRVLATRISADTDELDTLESSLKVQESKSDTEVKQLQAQLEPYQTAMDALTTKYHVKNDDLAKLEKEVEELGTDAIEKKLVSGRQMMDQLKAALDRAITKKADIETGNGTCPTCSQPVTNDVAPYVTKIEEIQVGIDKLQNKLNDLQGKYAVCLDVISRRDTLRADIKDMVVYGRELKAKIDGLNQAISSVTAASDTSKIKERIETLKVAIETNKATHTSLVDKNSIHAICTVLLKENGLKEAAIKTYIDILNYLMNKYMDMLGLHVTIELDGRFNEVIRARDRDEFEYANFSMGERHRINVSALFSWRELASIKASVSTNLLILDEILDSSVDADGVSAIIDLLRVLTKDSKLNIIAVSHANTAAFTEAADRVIKVSKVGNYSEIEVIE